jgi:hypothetical protein
LYLGTIGHCFLIINQNGYTKEGTRDSHGAWCNGQLQVAWE